MSDIQRYTTKMVVSEDGSWISGLRKHPEGELVFYDDVFKPVTVTEEAMTRFNPDPKLQAVAMWEQFYNLHNGLEVGVAPSEQIRIDKGKESAIIAANMCEKMSVIITPIPSIAPWTCSAYWQVVIIHLKEYNP